jgi:hypothetical protein
MGKGGRNEGKKNTQIPKEIRVRMALKELDNLYNSMANLYINLNAQSETRTYIRQQIYNNSMEKMSKILDKYNLDKSNLNTFNLSRIVNEFMFEMTNYNLINNVRTELQYLGNRLGNAYVRTFDLETAMGNVQFSGRVQEILNRAHMTVQNVYPNVTSINNLARNFVS